jgi:hypothetical protein
MQIGEPTQHRTENARTCVMPDSAGPRHFTIHPNGRMGYLITEPTATVGTYNIDKDKGMLLDDIRYCKPSWKKVDLVIDLAGCLTPKIPRARVQKLRPQMPWPRVM